MNELQSGSVSAIQDLGLKLETRGATQVKFIVIDRADQWTRSERKRLRTTDLPAEAPFTSSDLQTQ